MIEVELKAWLDDPEALKAGIAADFDNREAVKRDTYYGRVGKTAAEVDFAVDRLFRIRALDGMTWKVTVKAKRIEGGVEVNHETEFAIDDPDTIEGFIAFVNTLGYVPLFRKIKHTRYYRRGRLEIEVNRLDGLGDFLELEILLEDSASAAEIKSAKSELFAFLSEVGISEDRLEPRPYLELLRAKKAGDSL